MIEADLARIEAALDVELPESYRSTMLRFPIPACAGNADTELWDDADTLIAYNRELRDGAPGGVEPWPPHMFALGHGGDGCPMAIDLRQPEAPVWWVDHCHLDGRGSGQAHDSFLEFVERYVEDLRSDFLGDGIDPDGTPEEREAFYAREAREGCFCWLWVLALAVVAVLAGGILLDRF